ncbi:MAG: tetratricopeptide repeat protein, partial [Candidatus Omnitrophota bacterium]
ENGKYNEAVLFYKKALSVKPSFLPALKELAYCYQWTGNQPEAIRAFQEIILANPRDYAIKKSLAESLSWQKEYAQAIALYEEIIAETADSDAQIKLAQVYIWDAQPKRAKQILEGILKDEPKSFLARYLLAQALQYSNEPEEALNILEELAGEKISAESKKVANEELSNLLIEALISNKDYEKAELILNERIKNKPGSLKAKILLGQVYLYKGDYERAEEIFSGILKTSPDNFEANVYLADTFAYSGNFKEAEALYRKALSQKQELKAKIKLADVLSWDMKYDEAIKLYDETLKDAESSSVRLKKARILGWQGKYGQSLDEYRKIIKVAYDRSVDLEMQAKKYYWDNRVKNAISSYKKLILADPQNMDAAFDLSQIYSYQSMWRQAQGSYAEILNTSPNNFRAREGLEKAKLISEHSSLSPAYEYYRAESPSRDTNIRRQSLLNEFNRPLNYNLAVSGAYKLTFRSFADYGDVLENEGKIKLNFINNPDWRAGAYYDFIVYNKDIDTMHTFGASVNLRTFDYGTLGFYYDRERLENNSRVILGNFYSDNYKERFAIDVNKNLKLGLDYLFAKYSDSNYKHEPGFDVLYYLSFEPRMLTIKYRYFYKTFKNTVTDYFSPKNFSTNSLGLNWRHYLNREEVFFGANNLYYDLGYEASVDSTDIVGHRFSGEIGWDINKRLNINIKGSVVNSSCDVYKDSNVMASLKYYF